VRPNEAPNQPRYNYRARRNSGSTLVNVDDVEQAWHYTTASGLISIVSKHRLWATSAAYMNDRDEIRAGREALQKAINEQKPPLAHWQLQQLKTIGVMRAGIPTTSSYCVLRLMGTR
jgi:hypothetical protein